MVYLGLLWFNYGSYWVNYGLSWLTMFFLGGDNYSECRFCRFIIKDNPASRVTMFFWGKDEGTDDWDHSLFNKFNVN